MTTALLVVCSLTLVVVVVNFLSRRADHAAMARGIEERKVRDDEVWGLLKIVKGWAESARAHSKDAAAVVHGIQETVGRPEDVKTSERHVIEEVRKIPSATVDRAADRAARQDEKLDTIHSLVNSSYSAQLKISAGYARRVADLTRHPDDIKAAELAERLYDEHEREQQKQAAVIGAKAGRPGCVAPALLVGVALLLAQGHADAAERMRADNEATALAWWAAERPYSPSPGS